MLVGEPPLSSRLCCIMHWLRYGGKHWVRRITKISGSVRSATLGHY